MTSPEDSESIRFPTSAGNRKDGGEESYEWRRNLREDIRELKESQKEAERRLSKLERFQSMVLGAVAVIGAVGGYLVAWLRGEK